jgi:hypothetical protein
MATTFQAKRRPERLRTSRDSPSVMVHEEPIAALDVHQSLRGWADWRDKHRNSPNKVNSPLKLRVFTIAFNDY